MNERELLEMANRITTHEAVCAERWLEIIHRVKRVEMFILVTLVTLVAGMGSYLFTQVTG